MLEDFLAFNSRAVSLLSRPLGTSWIMLVLCTPTVSLGWCHTLHKFCSTPTLPHPPSPPHPFRACHLVTSLHSMTSRPCRALALCHGIYPITPRRCLYCWLKSSLSTLICEYPWSHCTSLHFNLEFGDLNLQRTSSAWQGMQPQRLAVSLLPRHGSKADEMGWISCSVNGNFGRLWPLAMPHWEADFPAWA